MMKTTLTTLSLLALMLTNLPGQVIEWREPRLLEMNTGSPSLPEVAVDGERYVTVWRHWLGSQRIHAAISTDDGAHWSNPAVIDSSAGVCTAPHFVMQSQQAAAIWCQAEGKTQYIGFNSSIDGGRTWRTAQRLSPGTGPVDRPRLALSGAKVAAVWVQADDVKKIVGRFSADGGATWDAEQTLSVGAVVVADPCLAADGDRVVAIWGQNNGSGIHLMAACSTDGGQHWQAARTLENLPGKNYSGDAWTFYPQVALAGSNVVAVWCQEAEGRRSVLFNHSSDGGATWEQAHVLSTGGATSFPRVAMTASSAVAVWMQPGRHLNCVAARQSLDGGKTWEASQILDNGSRPADNPALAMSGSEVRVAWRQHDGTQQSIFSNLSTDGGKTWQTAEQLESNSGMGWYPQVAADAMRTVACWMQQAPVGGWSVFVNHSAAGGQRWQSPRVAATGSGDTGAPCVAQSGQQAIGLWSAYDKNHWTVRAVYSGDGGESWKLSPFVATGPDDTGPSSAALSGKRAVAAWKEGEKIAGACSADGGVNWQSTTIASGAEVAAPAVAIAESAAVAVWRNGGAILAAASADGGQNWSGAQSLFAGDDGMEPRVAVAGTQAVAAWITHTEVWVSLSTDGGKSWEKARTLQTGSKNLGGVQVAVAGSQAVVVWRQHDGQANRIHASCSADGGRTWSAPAPVENGYGNVWGATVAIVDQKIMAFWKRRDERLNTPYGCYSADGGKTWSPSRTMSTGFGTDALPAVSLDGARVLGGYLSSDGVTWTLYINGGTVMFPEK